MTTRISAISGWFARDVIHAAMTASSFLAGIMAETVASEDAGMKALFGEGFCSLVDIVYWMLKGRFATQMIALV